jgi:hypothetical protein
MMPTDDDFYQFNTLMKNKLARNAHKDAPTRESIEGMIQLMEKEIIELREQLIDDRKDPNALLEAVDIGNFALLIFIALRDTGTRTEVEDDDV